MRAGWAMMGVAPFYGLVATAVLGSLVVALRRDAGRARKPLAAAGLAIAGLFALLGAGWIALLQTGMVLVGAVQRGRGLSSAGVGEDAEQGSARRIPAVLLVLTFFVIVVRDLLMARWPLAGKASALSTSIASAPESAAALSAVSAIGLPTLLVIGLGLFCIGLLASLVHRRGVAVAMGMELMGGAVALVLVSMSKFLGNPGGARLVAGFLILIVAVWNEVASRLVPRLSPAADGVLAARVSTGLLGVVAGVALVLMAGLW